ncbi:MAG: pseudaminic acid biosynthesis-associated methylase [Opitutae bacterium]|nr:pseudaminic acid biosynthesis-associated methylase [Opitutae bacterium]
MKYSTPQEEFWAGEFGDHYIDRNNTSAMIEAKHAMFRRALTPAAGIRSVVELGCNIGLNLIALSRLLPQPELRGVEINATAAARARENLPGAQITHGSLFDYTPEAPGDLAFTCGVLIHLNPDMLPAVYAKLASASRRFVLIAEYYNPSPVTVSYRGHGERLFKRDFAGEFLDVRREFRLADYGFVYRRDPHHPLDDLTWFLLEK